MGQDEGLKQHNDIESCWEVITIRTAKHRNKVLKLFNF